MSKQKSSAKTLIIADSDEAEGDELNPFSFREFIRCKNQSPMAGLDQEETSSASYRKQADSSQRNVTFDPDESSIFPDPSFSMLTQQDQNHEEEETTRFSSEARPSRRPGDRGGGGDGEYYEGDDESSMTEAPTSYRSSRLQQLEEENVCLRKTIMKLQKKSEASDQRLRQLSEELVQRRRQEDQEARALESMVMSVEQNLHLMTRRAVKAENGVSKLKLELQQLQGQLEFVTSDNERLRAGQMETIKTMKQNAQLAAEYLNKATGHAQNSIKQLLGEAETLCLVSQLLQSIDKISIHNSDIN
ncbi:endosome-associated-trafficking regulator 1 isoform 2-T2 [Polymixia lowei]